MATRDEATPTMPLIVVRVTARAATLEEFIGRYARYFRDGEVVFVPTEGVQPSGRRVKFVFALADGREVLAGEGVVLRTRRDSGDPRRPSGMELRYELSDGASRALVERLLSARKTPPPYVSMRIDGVADSQELTLPIERLAPATPTPTAAPPPSPPPSLASPPPSGTTPLPSRRPPPPTPVPLAQAAHPLPPIVTPSSVLTLRATLSMPPLSLSSSPPFGVPHASRGMRLAGTAVATAAAILAVTLAAAIMRRAPAAKPAASASASPSASRPASPSASRSPSPHATAGVGGNGVVVAAATPPVSPAVAAPPVVAGPRPESTGGARPPLSARAPELRATELRVTTSPPGARVFVDGEERGAAPLSVAVAAGAHDVIAERPRWNAAHAHVDRPGHVQLVLSRPQARIRFVSTPPGAAVRLDGRDVGVTPLELDADAYEQHAVRLQLDGRVWRRKIYLRPPGSLVDEPRTIRVAYDLGERVRP